MDNKSFFFKAQYHDKYKDLCGTEQLLTQQKITCKFMKGEKQMVEGLTRDWLAKRQNGY